ncbi:MAG TPA: transcriptional repressor LexA [Rhodospirillales bacterium]|jgi:repressor LexA|nr:transcriptional repressor LexA [Rhodospirillales bacterium]
MLTRKQYELLVYLDKELRKKGVSPSFDEMKDALGLKSKSGIHRLITGLEERGFIRRLPHRARAIEVLRLPDNMDGPVAKAGQKTTGKRFAANVIEGDFKLAGASPVAGSESVQLPLYGRIAAGTPIEALCDHSNAVGIPGNMIGKGEHYALEIEGDSMIDAGIHDGDTVVIRRSDTADNGSIVVALVEDTEVTLKRLRRKGASVALEPANTEYETRIFGPDQVKVQGCLVGLIRKY